MTVRRLPFGSYKETVPRDCLSPYQTNLLGQMRNQEITRRNQQKTIGMGQQNVRASVLELAKFHMNKFHYYIRLF